MEFHIEPIPSCLMSKCKYLTGRCIWKKMKQKTTLKIDHKILFVIIWSYRFYKNALLAKSFIIENMPQISIF